jgi:signal peptidase I
MWLRVLLPFLFVLAFLAWGFTTNYIPSTSMEPTLHPGDHILTMRAWLAYPGGRTPGRGDIVTFVPPPEALEGETTSKRTVRPEVWIKRVIGLPGEEIWIVGGRVLVNGTPLPQEYYRHSEDLYEYQFPYASFSPLVLGPDEVFVMGDNTEESDDSRIWGPLKRDFIVGKFIAVLFNEGSHGVNQRRAQEEGA